MESCDDGLTSHSVSRWTAVETYCHLHGLQLCWQRGQRVGWGWVLGRQPTKLTAGMASCPAGRRPRHCSLGQDPGALVLVRVSWIYLSFFFLFIFLISNEAAHALLFLQGLFLIFPGVSFLWIWKFALCVASHPFQSVSSERVLQTSSLVTEALWLLDKFLWCSLLSQTIICLKRFLEFPCLSCLVRILCWIEPS